MDQSLRTVATQLLNTTNSIDTTKTNEKGTTTSMKKISPKPEVEKIEEKTNLIKEVNSEMSTVGLAGVSFGRPINSKFGYLENSHPGQAMAMTEEELEKEISSTKVMAGYKNQPTTTGGISTWILLNPPSTTVKSAVKEKLKTNHQQAQADVRLTTKPTATILKLETSGPKIEQKVTLEKLATVSQVISTSAMEKLVSVKKPTNVTRKTTTTTTTHPSKVDKTTESLGKVPSSYQPTTKLPRSTTVSSIQNKEEATSIVATTRKAQIVRTTLRPKVTTPKIINVKPTVANSTKATRPNQSRPKPANTKRATTPKPDILKSNITATSKIEKVTFKPVQIITTTKGKTEESTERPTFITKIKASVMTNNERPTSPPPSTSVSMTLNFNSTGKLNFSGSDLVEIPVKSTPAVSKINNVLKVQLKKPVDETTKIEIEPIKVNAPILKIEKVDKEATSASHEQQLIETEPDLENSKIDVKFDFNPELTRINVETSTGVESTTSSTTVTSSSSSSSSSTTQRPRGYGNKKKKKNKKRKNNTRNSSTTTTATIVQTSQSTPATVSPLRTDTSAESSTELLLTEDHDIQESKIVPDTKVVGNATKTKKKQPQKAISTQIYNFLSREVMPSFGVMSLVGLGLGLASYFLYPFGGGAITRRNYEVEPNYKYNLDEYGGNYGQSEEEVLSKVFQGMTTGNSDDKFPGKDFDGNYYRYQQYDGAYDSKTTRKVDQRHPGTVSTSPHYKPLENAYSRNTEYRYSDSQTTPNYYDRQKHSDYVVGTDVSVSGNRQFVVGSVPKEYPIYDGKTPALPTPAKKVAYQSTESERTVGLNYNYPQKAVNVPPTYSKLTQTPKPEEGYVEVEITPTAVAVEHGPRSLKLKRSIADFVARPRRVRRDSVIQVIPSKREMEEEEKEEPLSNEILDIIDSALPGAPIVHEKHKATKEDNEVEDLDAQKKKQHEEDKTRRKHATLANKKSEDKEIGATESASSGGASGNGNDKSSAVDSKVDKINDGETFADPGSSSSSSDEHVTTVGSGSHDKAPEETTVDWFDNLTTKPPPPQEGFNIFNFVKKVAEIKLRLGLTILKHASEGFARYLGHVQKRINGEE